MRRNDISRTAQTLAEFHRSDQEWPSSVVFEDDSGRKIDTHPLTFDEHGDGWQANATGGAPYRWPREELTARGPIGGVEVPCISAELQLLWHTYPAFDDIDWHDVRLLCERFVLEAPEACRRRPGFVAAKRSVFMRVDR